MSQKISIIMPAYNAEKTCLRAIKSVLEQTFTDFELILIDDGSSDNTYNLCMTMAKTDKRLKVVHQKNGGVSAARNTGLAKASGEYICFVDSDDSIERTMLQKMYEAASKNSVDFIICGFKSCEKGNAIRQWIPKPTDNMDSLCEQLLKSDVGLNPLWTKMFKHNLVKIPFNTKKSMGEDLEFVCEFLNKAETCAVVPEALYRYTLDSNNSLTKDKQRVLNAIVDDMKKRTELIQIRGLDAQLVDDKFCEQMEGTLKRFESYKDFCGAINVVKDDNQMTALINSISPKKNKNKIIKFMLYHKSYRLLYMYMRIKDGARKAVK